MYQPSKFNTIFQNNKKFCVYNSLRGNIAVITDNEIQEMLLAKSINDSSKDVENLYEDGFIVRLGEDEDVIADVKQFDLIANKELYLTIMPTTKCNFRCKYCYQNNPEDENNFADNNIEEIVQNSIIKFVKSKIREFSGLSIEWYGGEPLLGLNTINIISKELISICQDRGKVYFATITTNGYLLSEEVFRQCLKNHIYSFHVTVDGFEMIHNKFRVLENGKGTYDTIIQNLRNIRDNIKSKYFKIILRTNISEELMPLLNDWIKFIFNEFGNDKRFEIFFRPVEDRGGNSIKNFNNSILNSMEKAYDIMIQSEYQLDYSFYKGFLFNSLCCAARRNTYIIDPKGRVKKCGEHLNNPVSDVGFLDKEGNIIIDREKLAKWVIKKNFNSNKICNSCKMSAACFNSSCPMKVNFSLENDFYLCGYEHIHINKIIDLLTIKDYDFIKRY